MLLTCFLRCIVVSQQTITEYNNYKIIIAHGCSNPTKDVVFRVGNLKNNRVTDKE